jgi:hypothetical protein
MTIRAYARPRGHGHSPGVRRLRRRTIGFAARDKSIRKAKNDPRNRHISARDFVAHHNRELGRAKGGRGAELGMARRPKGDRNHLVERNDVRSVEAGVRAQLAGRLRRSAGRLSRPYLSPQGDDYVRWLRRLPERES